MPDFFKKKFTPSLKNSTVYSVFGENIRKVVDLTCSVASLKSLSFQKKNVKSFDAIMRCLFESSTCKFQQENLQKKIMTQNCN